MPCCVKRRRGIEDSVQLFGCNLDRYVITKFALPYRNHHFVIKNTEMAKNLRFDVGTNSLLRCAGVTFGAKSNQKRGGCDSPAPLNAEYVPYCLTNSGATAHIRSQRAQDLCVCRHIHISYQERRYALSVPPLQRRGQCPHRPIQLFDKFQFT